MDAELLHKMTVALRSARGYAIKEAGMLDGIQDTAKDAWGAVQTGFPLGQTYQAPGSPLGRELPEVGPDLLGRSGLRGSKNNYDAQNRMQSVGHPTTLTIDAKTIKTPMATGAVPYPDLINKGYTRNPSTNTFSYDVKPIRYSQQTQDILNASKGWSKSRATARVEGTVKSALQGASWMQKIQGPRVYFGALRKDAMSIYSQAQAYQAAGKTKEARQLFNQYGILRSTITQGEPKAEKVYAPYRNMATAGLGAVGIIMLLSKLFGGSREN